MGGFCLDESRQFHDEVAVALVNATASTEALAIINNDLGPR